MEATLYALTERFLPGAAVFQERARPGLQTYYVKYEEGEALPFEDPFTKQLVIVNRQNLPEELLRNLKFMNPKKSSALVTEIEYSKADGRIFYDIDERDNPREDGYARLITLNWWYQAFSMILLNGALLFLDLYSNAIFCANLVIRHETLKVTMELALAFPVCYVLLEGMTICHSYAQTKKDWAIKVKAAGDLVDDKLNRVDSHHAFFAMVLFYFIGVDSLVRDIVVWLHPFKAVQPYCAFKSDGHRAYIVGWATEYMFRCDNSVRQHVLMIPQVGVRLILLIFKAIIACNSLDEISLGLCVPSILFLVVRIYKIYDLIHDRHQHWDWLNKEWDRLKVEMAKGASPRSDMQTQQSPKSPESPESAERNKLWGTPSAKDRITQVQSLRDWEQVLKKQKDLHFPNDEWGKEFRGWKLVMRRFQKAVLLPSVFLLMFVVADKTLFGGHLHGVGHFPWVTWRPHEPPPRPPAAATSGLAGRGVVAARRPQRKASAGDDKAGATLADLVSALTLDAEEVDVVAGVGAGERMAEQAELAKRLLDEQPGEVLRLLRAGAAAEKEAGAQAVPRWRRAAWRQAPDVGG